MLHGKVNPNGLITRIEAILFYIYFDNNVCAGIQKAQTNNK